MVPPDRWRCFVKTDPRQQHVDHITGVLRGEFPSGIDPETLRSEVDGIYADLEHTSKVDAFIPILALRRSRARVDVLVADRSAVAGFVEAGPEPRYQPGDVARLVDGRFQVTHVEPTRDAVRYVGRWLDPVEAHG
jgi:hypothetical protein